MAGSGLPELRASKGRLVLTVHVQPGASRRAVVGRHGDACKVAVPAPPTEGRANSAVVAVVSEALGVPARDVEVIAGHTSRRKLLAIGGLTLGEATDRLRTAYGI